MVAKNIQQWNSNLFCCKKQTTVAIIMKNNQVISIASNYIKNNIQECPRKNMPTGQSYDLCKTICNQVGHAEENACKLAEDDAKGAVLYLIGHYYICNSCLDVMKKYKIDCAIICNTGEIINISGV